MVGSHLRDTLIAHVPCWTLLEHGSLPETTAHTAAFERRFGEVLRHGGGELPSHCGEGALPFHVLGLPATALVQPATFALELVLEFFDAGEDLHVSGGKDLLALTQHRVARDGLVALRAED